MFFPWYAATLLAIESNGVIGLRLLKLAEGGTAAIDEVQLMVSEKLGATIEAGTSLMLGVSTSEVVDRIREHVAANATRLSKA